MNSLKVSYFLARVRVIQTISKLVKEWKIWTNAIIYMKKI